MHSLAVAQVLRTGSLVATAAVFRMINSSGSLKSRQAIALCCPDLKSGGIQRMTLLIAERLLERGHAVDLLLSDRSGPLVPPTEGDIRVIALPSSPSLVARAAVIAADPLGLPTNLRPLVLPLKGFPSLRVLPALSRYFKAEQPRSVFAPSPDLIFSTGLARRLAGVQTRLVASFRSHLSAGLASKSKLRGRTLLPALERALREFSAVHAVSHAVADDLAALFDLKRENIQVFHSPTLSGDIEQRAAELPEHPWFAADREVPVVVAVGRISPQKDYATLFRALAYACRSRPLRLVVVGDDGPVKAAEGGRAKTAQRVLDLIQALDIAEAVDFVGYQPNPLSWIAHADLFALSSRFEGLPNVVIEALACGRTVVATDAPGGTAEILREGCHGYLAAVGDAGGLGEALLKGLAQPLDPNLQKARAADFDWQSSLEAYERLLAPAHPER